MDNNSNTEDDFSFKNMFERLELGTITYVENQLLSVSSKITNFCSEFIDEVLPASLLNDTDSKEGHPDVVCSEKEETCAPGNCSWKELKHEGTSRGTVDPKKAFTLGDSDECSEGDFLEVGLTSNNPTGNGFDYKSEESLEEPSNALVSKLLSRSNDLVHSCIENAPRVEAAGVNDAPETDHGNRSNENTDRRDALPDALEFESSNDWDSSARYCGKSAVVGGLTGLDKSAVVQEPKSKNLSDEMKPKESFTVVSGIEDCSFHNGIPRTTYKVSTSNHEDRCSCYSITRGWISHSIVGSGSSEVDECSSNLNHFASLQAAASKVSDPSELDWEII